MANVLGIIRNKASGIAGAVELFIDNVKQTQYKKCYITNENIIGFEGKNGEVSSSWGGSTEYYHPEYFGKAFEKISYRLSNS